MYKIYVMLYLDTEIHVNEKLSTVPFWFQIYLPITIIWIPLLHYWIV